MNYAHLLFDLSVSVTVSVRYVRSSFGVVAKNLTLLDERLGPTLSLVMTSGDKKSLDTLILSLILSFRSGFYSKSGYWRLLSLVSFILTENHCLVEVVARELRVVSSGTTGSTAGTGSASKDNINVQTFVILALSFWIVEEYLNKM